MTLVGRPLRFVTMLLLGWVAMRCVVVSFETVEAHDAIPALADGGPARIILPPERAAPPGTTHVRARVAIRNLGPAPLSPVEFERLVNDNSNFGGGDTEAMFKLASLLRPTGKVSPAVEWIPGVSRSSSARGTKAPAAALAAPVQIAPVKPDRWAASSWVIARDSFGPRALAPGGTLGGSQAGTRVLYRPGWLDNRLGLFARTSSPLRGLGSDVAVGAEYQPFARVPVRMALEQRFPLDRGAARGTALSLVGGVSDVALADSLRLDAYGQAGVIGMRRRLGFADGAVTLNRKIARINNLEIGAGAGSWGAIQPGIARIDAGPRIELKLPIAGRPTRVGLEWRQRLIGNAAPGSGAAITMGSDF